MSLPIAPEPSTTPRGPAAVAARTAVALGFALSALRPPVLRRILTTVRRGSRPSTVAEAAAARAAVCAVSVRCAGQGCLPRSVAVVLLCRLRGHTPGWSSGFRTDPFVAHAWVEVDGVPVSEPAEVAAYVTVLRVPAPQPGASPSVDGGG